MRSCQVPTPYIHLINCMLSDRQTQLYFNDFTSEPILLSTTQGCPLSMLLYAFYNMELIKIAHGKNKLEAGFVDNCAFVATADNLNNSHRILKDMMECPNGVLNWSLNHNSKFEISKLAIMDFPHPHKAKTLTPLIIKQRLEDGTTTTNTITNVQNYRYLGIIFDPKLSWRAHISKVIANATCWSQQLWRVARTAGGLSPSCT